MLNKVRLSRMFVWSCVHVVSTVTRHNQLESGFWEWGQGLVKGETPTLELAEALVPISPGSLRPDP